ncbi:MAG: YDG domain-containing protein, partial [Betaproteobacteria bacterium]
MAPVLTPVLAGTVSKVYDATAQATLANGNLVVSGGINGDSLALSAPASSTYDTKNVGTAKTVTASGLSIGSAIDTNGKPVFGYQLGATSASAAIGTISAAPLTVSAVTNTRGYDSTVAAAGGPTITSGTLKGTDTVVLSETYSNKNAGTGKTLVPAAVIADGNGGANYSVTLVNNTTGVITPATLTSSGISANNKVYDGNAAATLNTATATVAGVFPNDVVALNGGTGTFADRNASLAKTVTPSAVALSGADAGNYVVATPGPLSANITQLGSVAWAGGVTGNWSQASNWTGGALPDAKNVLAVTIPSGSSVTYDAGMATANASLNTLTSSGSLILAGGPTGVLTINNQLTTPQLAINSGTLAGTGNLTVNGAFSQQTGSAIALTGSAVATITQAANNLVVGSLSAPSVLLTAQSGSISQIAPIAATASLQTSSFGGTTLTDAGNQIRRFSATSSTGGDIALKNAVPLRLDAIDTTGRLSVDNVGAVDIQGPVNVGPDVSIVAHSPISVGSAGITSTGNIVLTASATAGAGADLTIAGPLTSTGSGAVIALSAGDNLVQNASITSNKGNISATALTGSVSMSSGATTTSNGGSIGYAAPAGNIVLASLNAGTGPIGVSAGGN